MSEAHDGEHQNQDNANLDKVLGHGTVADSGIVHIGKKTDECWRGEG
jgi:hypothetical protein